MSNQIPPSSSENLTAPSEIHDLMRVDAARIDAYITVWSKVVDTQMHFNEMCAKSRQLGLTFVVAALGVSIVLLGRQEDYSLRLPLLGLSLHVSVLIILSAALAVYAVSILDLNVYHRMLRGAVAFGEDFEENHLKALIQLNKGMTQAISHFSRAPDAGVRKQGTRYEYIGLAIPGKAQNEIWRFYKYTILTLLVAALLTFLATVKWHENISPTNLPTSNTTLGIPSK